MVDPETKRKARELGVAGLAEIIDAVSADPSYAALTFDEKIRIVIDHTHAEMGRKQVESLLKSAQLSEYLLA